MQEERLAELLERYHSGESNAATSRELECVFSIKGIEVRQMVNRLRRKGIPIASSGSGYLVLLRRYGTGGAGDHRPSDTADQRNRCRYCRPEPIPGAV